MKDELAALFMLWIKENKMNTRNKLCYCGSGKKYKKCCMELPKVTPKKEKSFKCGTFEFIDGT